MPMEISIPLQMKFEHIESKAQRCLKVMNDNRSTTDRKLEAARQFHHLIAIELGDAMAELEEEARRHVKMALK